jgi:hypothetical protein
MSIIIISSLISLLTIGILFFRPQSPKKREIPSWFLGKNYRKFIQNRLLFTKPPIILIFIVLLITLIFAICYYPRTEQSSTMLNNKIALIWLDPSLMATLSRLNSNFSAEEEANKIFNLGFESYGLKNSFIIEDGKITIKYNIEYLKRKQDYINFFNDAQNSPVSPFIQSIHLEKLEKQFLDFKIFQNKKLTIIAFSDGNSESIQGFFSLKKFFNRGLLFKSSIFIDNNENEKEIVPTDLFSLWNEKSNSSSDFSFFNYKNSLIPENSRPHFFIKNFNFDETNYNLLKIKDTEKILPLFIGCSDSYPSPIELDSFSSLRVLVSFFGNNFIEKICEKQNENYLNKKNIWKYRNSTVWVVPTNDNINSAMSNDLAFWIPEGFDLNFDTLVYTAGHFFDQQNIDRSIIQLDNGSMPISLHLSAPPPASELGIQFPGDTRIYKSYFKPLIKAHDETILAWKATSLPIFYLRTGTASPNSELGKSRTWTNFWFEVSKSLKNSNLAFSLLEIDDINKLQEKLEDLEFTDNTIISDILDLSTLNFKPTNYFTLGLYKTKNPEKWIFIKNSGSEKNSTYISKDEFFNFFSSDSEISDRNNYNNIDRSYFKLLSATLGIILLLLLWKKDKKIIKNIAILILLFQYKNNNYAQNFESFNFPFTSINNNKINANENNNINFRIAWCDKTLPEYTEKNYLNLRNILLKRGTIHLPKNLLLNSCIPGLSEIWWTDNISLINKNLLEKHLSNGGIFIIEGQKKFPQFLNSLNNPNTGLEWEFPNKRGMFYRSFYLLQSIDGCLKDNTRILMLKKKINAQAPFGIVTEARFISNGSDCFLENNDYKIRSFINIMYSLLTTDYKEDQMQLPEILNRIRNLGLEP